MMWCVLKWHQILIWKTKNCIELCDNDIILEFYDVNNLLWKFLQNNKVRNEIDKIYR